MDQLVPFVDAAEVKRALGKQRAELTRSVRDIKRRQEAARAEIEAQRKALEVELAKRTAELEAQMKPMQEQLAKMQEVLWTVNLYLGRDETLRLIRDGQPAGAETPITIRQKVLVMAEESLILMDHPGSKGMDYRNIDAFVGWLTAAPENLDRVLPEPKGLVVLVPTRVESRSGNPWEDASKNAANQSSYWLLRNGERLYLLTVDPELRVRDRVLPRRTEFTEVFDQGLFGYGRRSGEPLEPGSEEWLGLEKKADARRRHYMRIMMVLQGIVDRTPAWQPLPGGGVNLLSVEAQESGKVVLIQDGDPSIALGDGAETFAAYQKRLNGLLRPGLRVIGNWGSTGFREYERDYDNHWTGKNTRLHPPNASHPDSATPHLLEDRRRGGFVFRYERTDEVWKRDVPVPGKPGYVYRGLHPTTPAQRASCLVLSDDKWVLPYDLATVPELERFLASREERSKHFLSMVPTIKAALAAKQAEAATEGPFRVLLRGLLLNAGAEDSTVQETLDDLVHWWKVKNTWSKPLNGEPEHEARAAREIVTEAKARQKAKTAPDLTEKMVKAGRQVPDAICVAQNRQGKWFAYAPSNPHENVFLDITPIRKDGTLGETKTWARVQQRTASLLNVAWTDEAWATRLFAANPRHYLTGPEREAMVEQVLERAAGLPLAVVEFHDPAHPAERGFASYSWVEEAPPEEAEVVAAHDPLGGGGYGSSARQVAMKAYRVEKDAHGVRLLVGNISRGYAENAFRPYFGGYSGGSKWGNTPWWPTEGVTQYAQPRPRLVWSDETALDRMNDWRLRCIAAADAQQEERRSRDVLMYRYVNRVQDLILSRLEAEARERFIEDFGNAEDLWDAHLKSLNLRSPIHDRTLWGLFTIRHQAGLSIAGETLGELARYAYEDADNRAPGEWHPDHGIQDLHGWDELVVPEGS